MVRRVADPSCGAVVVFSGTVRDSHRGRPVDRITYSAYRAMAQARLREIASRLERRYEGTRVAIVHRLGELRVGEPSVVIAVASPHREAAYAANREALERLKTEVPIWKREHYADGESRWREEEPLAGRDEKRGRRRSHSRAQRAPRHVGSPPRLDLGPRPAERRFEVGGLAARAARDLIEECVELPVEAGALVEQVADQPRARGVVEGALAAPP